MVKPILLYGCECWGYGNNAVLEKVQLKFLKTILGLKSCTASYFVYGETGITPLSVDIEARTENGCMPISNKSSQICLCLIFMQK